MKERDSKIELNRVMKR